MVGEKVYYNREPTQAKEIIMALIQCKYCERTVSDRAKNCPHCGGVLIEERDESKQDDITTRLCEECSTEMPKDAVICPNCGCPVSEGVVEPTVQEVEAYSAQKVEVTAVNLKMRENTKKYLLIGIIAAILIGIIGYAVSSHNKKVAEENARLAAEEYISDVEGVTYTMLTGAADAEDAGNLIKRVWYNSIYEEYDSETDKYTRPYGYFFDDFNDALEMLFEDASFKSLLSSIEDNQSLVSGLMKDLKNPPEEHKEAYEALKAYYGAYLELTNMVTNLSGSYTTFSEGFNDSVDEVVRCLNTMDLYIEE